MLIREDFPAPVLPKIKIRKRVLSVTIGGLAYSRSYFFMIGGHFLCSLGAGTQTISIDYIIIFYAVSYGMDLQAPLFHVQP